MAKKVTVSIPDMLHEKMEQWRESFNLSKMFQDAVTEAIQKKEELQKRIREDLDLNQIVERLRKEKKQSEGNYYDSGKIDGVRWARTAHYEDLVYACSWSEGDSFSKDEVLGEYFIVKLQENPLMEITEAGINEYLRVYLEGWKSGVQEFWQEVSDKL